MLEEVCRREGAGIGVVSLLDSASEGELFDDAVRTGVLFKYNVFSIIDAPLFALKTQVGLTLDRIRKQGGPERQVSQSRLVPEAGDLWTREQRGPGTDYAVQKGDENGSPAPPRGRIVVAV